MLMIPDKQKLITLIFSYAYKHYIFHPNKTPGLLTRPWADEAKAEAAARWNEVEAEASCSKAEAKARFSGLEAEALTST